MFDKDRTTHFALLCLPASGDPAFLYPSHLNYVRRHELHLVQLQLWRQFLEGFGALRTLDGDQTVGIAKFQSDVHTPATVELKSQLRFGTRWCNLKNRKLPEQ
jgi:hypothetical protein